MKLARSQRFIVLILGIIAVIAYGFLGGLIARNARLISEVLAPTDTLLPSPPTQTAQPTVPPTTTFTPEPTPTPTPSPLPSPTSPSEAPPSKHDQEIADDPKNPVLYTQRGFTYLEAGAHEPALNDFDTALELNETLAEAHLGRGQAYYYLKQWRLALTDFEQAIALNPDLADAHAWKGHLLAERGEYSLAIEALRQAITLDDADALKHIWLAEVWLESGRVAAAEAEYDRAISLGTQPVRAYIGRAFAQADLGELEAMQTSLSHAMSAGPFDPVALNGRAWLYAQYEPQRLYEAQQLAQQAIAKAQDDLERARYMHTLGLIYYKQQYWEKAISTLEEAAALATIEGEVVYDGILEDLEKARAAQPSP